MSLYTQWLTVLFMLLSGLALGCLFDSYRVFAGQCKFPRWMIPFFDLLYWLVATLFVFYMLMKSNQGELRFYIILGLVTGTWMYAVFLSTITIICMKWIMSILTAGWKLGMKCIHILFFLPLTWAWMIVKLVIMCIKLSAIFLLKNMLQCLRVFWSLICWLGKPFLLPVWKRLKLTRQYKSLCKVIIYVGQSIMKRVAPINLIIKRIVMVFFRQKH